MSFYVDIQSEPDKLGQMRTVLFNLIRQYEKWYLEEHNIKGKSVFEWQHQNNIPRLSGINEWAQEKHGIFLRPYYDLPEAKKNFHLEPMPDRCNWNIVVDGGDNFVGPRSKKQLKKIEFFKSTKNRHSLFMPYGSSLEAIQWQTDVIRVGQIYYDKGFGAAVDHAMSLGYSRLTTTIIREQSSIKGFFLGFSGSHNMHSGHEKLWLKIGRVHV